MACAQAGSSRWLPLSASHETFDGPRIAGHVSKVVRFFQENRALLGKHVLAALFVSKNRSTLKLLEMRLPKSQMHGVLQEMYEDFKVLTHRRLGTSDRR